MKKTAALCALTFMLSSGVDADTVKMASEMYVTQKVSAVSNYADRAISASTKGMVTMSSLTNDVAAIVTNRIHTGYTDWKFFYNGEPTIEFSLVEFSDYNYDLIKDGRAYGQTVIEPGVTEVEFGMGDNWDETDLGSTLLCTRELTYSNSLGLMQEDDLKRTIAMFIIPVNTDGSGSSYAGFELKASTNNFSHADGTEDTRLQFYAQSEVADKDASWGNNWDKMKMYVGTGYGSSWDVRAYTKIGNTIDWGHELRNVVVLVDASCIVKHPGDWLREDNEDLMWCYLRNTNGDGGEKEEGTTRTLWHPIAPVRWFKKLPNWANQ